MPIRPIKNPHADPPPDEGEFDLSQLSGPGDDEEENEEEEEDDDEPEAPPAAARASEPEATMPRRRGRKPRDPKPEGMGATVRKPKTYWHDRNIEVLWPEVLEYLRTQHRPPHDVDIRVKRTEPVEALIGQPFNGGTVMGGEGRAASTAIVDKITDEYHMISGALGPTTYKVEIFWRINSQVLTWGTLRLPSPDAIIGMRRAQQNAQQNAQPPTMGAPWQHYAPPPPQYAFSQPSAYPSPPYAGYGAPPPPPPPAYDPSSAEMRAELGYLRGTLDEVLRAAREGRQPNIQPPPTPGAPPSVEDIARRVAEILRPGLGAPPVMATPNVVPPTPATSVFESSVQSIMQSMMQGVLKKVAGNVDSAIRGDGSASHQPNEAVAEVVDDDPKEDLPFQVIPVGSKWPDGREVFFPKKKTDGSIDYMGVLAANPFLMEKLADSASGLIGSVGDLVKNLGRAAIPGAAEVVNNIPRGAVQAGMGQPQAPPPQPSPPPAPTMTPHANGVPTPPSGGGWPT